METAGEMWWEKWKQLNRDRGKAGRRAAHNTGGPEHGEPRWRRHVADRHSGWEWVVVAVVGGYGHGAVRPGC
jgi:hypothetical protein